MLQMMPSVYAVVPNIVVKSFTGSKDSRDNVAVLKMWMSQLFPDLKGAS